MLHKIKQTYNNFILGRILLSTAMTLMAMMAAMAMLMAMAMIVAMVMMQTRIIKIKIITTNTINTKYSLF